MLATMSNKTTLMSNLVRNETQDSISSPQSYTHHDKLLSLKGVPPW